MASTEAAERRRRAGENKAVHAMKLEGVRAELGRVVEAVHQLDEQLDELDGMQQLALLAAAATAAAGLTGLAAGVRAMLPSGPGTAPEIEAEAPARLRAGSAAKG